VVFGFLPIEADKDAFFSAVANVFCFPSALYPVRCLKNIALYRLEFYRIG
jgi:hypothetical protein